MPRNLCLTLAAVAGMGVASAPKAALMEPHPGDSSLFSNRLPEEIRAKAAEAAKRFELQKRRLDSARLADPTRIEELKFAVEQWRQAWEAKRDSQVAKIPDPALRGTVQIRIAEVARHHAAVSAQLRERRHALHSRGTDLKPPPPVGPKPIGR